MPKKKTIKPLKFTAIRDPLLGDRTERVLAVSKGECDDLYEKFGLVSYRHGFTTYICNREVVNMKEFRAMTNQADPEEESPEQFRWRS